MSDTATLLITEWYLPVVGGSVNYFVETYRRYPEGQAHVLTGFPEAAGPDDPSPVPTTRVDSRRRWWTRPESLGMYWRFWRHAGRLVREQGFGEIHCGHVLPEALVAWLVGRRHGVPYVVYCHGEEVSIQRRDALKRRVMPFLYNRAAAIIANSHNSRQLLLDLGVRPELVHVVNPGVDLDKFTPVPPPAREPGEIVLLTVGRHQARKGHDQALRAVAQLAPKYPGLRYRIAGDGEETPRLKALCTELGLDDRVEWLGTVPHDELAGLYQDCDIFLMANRHMGDDDLEGFGMVFLEAAACAKPSIGGDSGGVPDAVEQDVTGLLVDTEDIGAIAGAIERLAQDPALRARMGEAGRARCEREFDWRAVSARIRGLVGDRG